MACFDLRSSSPVMEFATARDGRLHRASLHMAQMVDLATNKDAHGQGCGLHAAWSWVCYQALTPSLYILDRPACDSILPPPELITKHCYTYVRTVHASEPKCTNCTPCLEYAC